MGQPVPFVSGYKKGNADIASGGRLTNLHARLAPPDAEHRFNLWGTAGTELFCDLGVTTPVLGMIEFRGRVYAATKTKLFEINSAGTATDLGTVLLGGKVSMSKNRSALVMVDGISGYSYDGTTLAKITDAAFYPSSSVTNMDDFLIFVRDDTEQFFISGSNALTFDALDFASAESQADRLIAVLQDHRELWLFGETSTEVWYNSGAAAFPFERMSGAVIEHGIASKWAAAKADNAVFVMSEDGICHSYRGFQPQRISTHEIEDQIAARSLSSAEAFAWYDRGHVFVQWTIGDLTIVWDEATREWHTRSHIDHGRHIAGCYVKAFGKHLVGDYSTGKIYRMAHDIYDDAGRPMIAEAVSAPITANRGRLTHDQFEIRAETGVGLTTGQGSDPQIMMQFQDEGKPISREYWKTLGKKGETDTLIRYRRLGQSRSRRYRLTISDPVQRVIAGAGYLNGMGNQG